MASYIKLNKQLLTTVGSQRNMSNAYDDAEMAVIRSSGQKYPPVV